MNDNPEVSLDKVALTSKKVVEILCFGCLL